MLEYYISILEFLFVMALSTFLIPLYFIDATKQYAAGIIKTVLTYFLKILTTTTVCFYIISSFIGTEQILLTKDPGTLTTSLLYISCLFMGLILSKKSGAFVSAALTGNPSFGVQDIAHQSREMMHAARTGMHLARGASKIAGNTIQATGRGVGNAINAGAGMYAAGRAAAEGAAQHNASGFTPISTSGAAFRGAMSYAGHSMAQHIGDAAYSAFTGQKPMRKSENDIGYGKIGQTYTDARGQQRTITANEARRLNKTKGQELGKNVVEKMAKPIYDAAASTLDPAQLEQAQKQVGTSPQNNIPDVRIGPQNN